MRFADSEEDALAKTVIEIKIPFAVLSPSEIPPGHLQPGTYPHTRFQIAALRYVRDALTNRRNGAPLKSSRSVARQNYDALPGLRGANVLSTWRIRLPGRVSQ
jgi:hypothetical protein